jgi:hypothetical protein
MREIDRIATDDATIVVIGFNKFSLWSLIKIFSSKPPVEYKLFVSHILSKSGLKYLNIKLIIKKLLDSFRI